MDSARAGPRPPRGGILDQTPIRPQSEKVPEEEQQEATTPLPIDDGIPYAPILFLVLVVVCAQLNCIIERHRFGGSNARRSA